MFRDFVRRHISLLDVLILPIAFVSGIFFKLLRRAGLQNFTRTHDVLAKIGVLPIRHHYYEPLVLANDLKKPLDEERSIPGLDLNVEVQLEILSAFDFAGELSQIPLDSDEYLYSMIRHFHPKRIIEIGSGHSTLLTRVALKMNSQENPGYACNHSCIEPFHNLWLQRTGARVIREKVEDMPLSEFRSLGPNDILFIDSSHVIRPQGDVLFEYFDILGALKSGVFIHAHDIFTPRDYPESWVLRKQRLWNEQYLLEAFLSFNNRFEVTGALNFLWHNYPEEVGQKCPVQAVEPHNEPGSLWFRKL